MTDATLCPCGTGKQYKDCCQPFHTRSDWPEDPETLMRSRYSAFVKGEVTYIVDSTDPSRRAGVKEKDLQDWSAGSEWLGLTIHGSEGGGPEQNEGTVDFEAHYRVQESGEEVFHRELATFRRKEGRWFFHDGKVRGHDPITNNEEKVGRNDPCPCGSGKKFKKCCA